MSEQLLIKRSTLTDIADAIRAKTGTTSGINVSNLATEIEEKTIGISEQPTPEISVSSSGLITATAGTKSSTYQLAFQPAKTIIPTTTSQIAVSNGYYTGGNVMVAGDSNLVAGNIKSGVSIFGVTGTLEEGGSGGETVVDDVSKAIIEGTITEISDDEVKTIGYYAFYSCSSLTSVSFPACKTIGNFAFCYCSSLRSANFPACTTIGNYAFRYCYKLSQFYLAGSSVCNLFNSNAFLSTPYAGYSTSFSGTPYIYVPSSLLTTYQTATNWTYFSSYFSAIENAP